jgi:hypothetical protein
MFFTCLALTWIFETFVLLQQIKFYPVKGVTFFYHTQLYSQQNYQQISLLKTVKILKISLRLILIKTLSLDKFKSEKCVHF